MQATPAKTTKHTSGTRPDAEARRDLWSAGDDPGPGGDYVHLQLRRFHAYDQWTVDELLDHAHHLPM
jgi:hypothetical protein